MPSRLYIKILMEIIEHQFESVESLMELPDEYRISPRSTSPGGVSTMEMSGKSVLVLLRENMKTAQKLKFFARSITFLTFHHPRWSLAMF
ncbi:hypothetical protein F5144DRAFT_565301 [Chaetomium tenue]|uniref:Uncharacterized protein n=1 Tax=Chaetomium tenue TaxID=1854479 RepID=A0ACB7PK78_9PEZI|nr:hypothetical protein F5144DRAFT_565301 [Chaetomium globosum]